MSSISVPWPSLGVIKDAIWSSGGGSGQGSLPYFSHSPPSTGGVSKLARQTGETALEV